MSKVRTQTRLSVRGRLTCWFVAIAVATAAVGFFAVSTVSDNVTRLRDDTEALQAIGDVRTSYTQMRMEVIVTVLAVVGKDSGAGFLRDDAIERQTGYDRAVDENLARWKATTTLDTSRITAVDNAVAAHREIVNGVALPLATGGTPTLAPPPGAAAWDVGSTLSESNRRYLALSDVLVDVARLEREHFEADAADAAAGASRTRNIVIIGGLAAIVAAGIVGSRIAQRFSMSLRDTITVLDRVRDGDYSARVAVDSDDEFGALGRGLNDTVSTLGAQAADLARTTAELHDASVALTSVSHDLSEQAASVSSRANEVSDTVRSMSSHATSVSIALEEMNSSIVEIASRAAEATSTSRLGSEETRHAAGIVRALDRTTAEIERLVSSIGSIAEQTNMLALNATIEAARAGESGRGFAVVANEVQELAGETARAAQEIERSVNEVRAGVEQAVAAMTRVEQRITEVDATQTVIASAVEEQTATCNEMAQAVGLVARNVADVEHALASVTRSAEETRAGTSQTLERAAMLAGLAERLRHVDADSPAR